MAQWHLDDLRNRLWRAAWTVTAELEGNGYDVSKTWRVERPDGSRVVHLEFEGLDDMGTLPLVRAYACRVREYPALSLYFRRPGDRWKREVDAFIGDLDRGVI